MIDVLDRPPWREAWALDVGGSHATAAVVDGDAHSARVREMRSSRIDPHSDSAALLDAMARPALELADGVVGGAGTRDWVVAMPGPFDYLAGVGAFDDVGKFDSLRGVSVRRGISTRLGVAEDRLHFLNDAAAYGIGEWAYGAGEQLTRVVCITLGTGVGSAFVDRGEVVDSGDDVPPHGWAHLLTFDGRPLEDTVSTRAITATYADRTGRSETVRSIAAAALRGERDAGTVIDGAMRALGSTLAPWLAAFHAERLVVGGSMAKSWALLETPLVQSLRDAGMRADALDVRPSTLLEHAPVLGGAFWLHHALTPPSTSTSTSTSTSRSERP